MRFCIKHRLLPEVQLTKIEYDYKAIRRRLLKGMSARYTAIICPAHPSVAEAPLNETKGVQSLVLMAAPTELSDLGSSEHELFDSENNEKAIPITQKSLLKCPENYQPIAFTNERHASKKTNLFSESVQPSPISVQDTQREPDVVQDGNDHRNG